MCVQYIYIQMHPRKQWKHVPMKPSPPVLSWCRCRKWPLGSNCYTPGAADINRTWLTWLCLSLGGVPRWIPGTSTRNHRKPWILAAKCGGPCQKKLKSILGSYQALSWLQLFFCCRCNSASLYHFWPWWIHSSALGLMQQNCDASVVMIGIIYMELHLFFVYHVYITSICVYVFISTLKHHQNWPPLKINRATILNGSHSLTKQFQHVAALVDPWPAVKQSDKKRAYWVWSWTLDLRKIHRHVEVS